MAKTMVLWDLCDGSPGSVSFEPGWGMHETRKSAVAKLKEVRQDGFTDAYLAKVTYERCSEPVLRKRKR